MLPSQLAAVLGLDEYDAIRPIPFPDELVAEAERVEQAGIEIAPVTAPAPERRLRRIVGADDA